VQSLSNGQNGKGSSATTSSGNELDEALDKFFAAHGEKLPALPKDFGRVHIYNDHD
jgi:hypothetical protein